MTTKTKTKFGSAMFDSIKAALNKSKDSSGGQFANIMKFPAGHTYTLRLVPNIEDPEKTFFHHWVHGWNSKSTGSYMSYIGLQTMGERDPISELRWKLYKAWKDTGPSSNDKYEAEITQKENWFVNVYVIDDPSNPENNGTVKVLRMGPQLKKIIDEATEGDRADELGWDIFDLSKGHDLKIKAEQKGPYTTFESSFFTTKSKTVLDDEEIEKIYSEVHDLEAIYTVKTYEELQEILNEHFFNKGEKEERKTLAKAKKEAVADDDDDDDIPMFHEEKKAPSKAKKEVKKEDSDDEIDDLLAGLED
jgi:hypothetical protein